MAFDLRGCLGGLYQDTVANSCCCCCCNVWRQQAMNTN